MIKVKQLKHQRRFSELYHNNNIEAALFSRHGYPIDFQSTAFHKHIPVLMGTTTKKRNPAMPKGAMPD